MQGLSNLTQSRLALETYTKITKLLGVRPLNSSLKSTQLHGFKADFQPTRHYPSPSRVREILSAVSLEGFSLEDLELSVASIKTLFGKHHVYHSAVIMASEEGESFLFFCGFCPETGSFEFRKM